MGLRIPRSTSTSRSRFTRSFSATFTQGRKSPSSNRERANGMNPPGSEPPVSGVCVSPQAHPTSSPSHQIGVTIIWSGQWAPPM